MKYKEKQILFDKFINEWGLRFNKIPFLFRYIASYPELTSKLDDYNPLKAKNLSETQLEWVSLVSQFDHPIDSKFFKPYWIPIQSDSYDYFLDLSTDTFSIFEVNYFFLKPYRWYKKYLFKDIVDFLISVDDHSININDHLVENSMERWNEVDGFFQERDMLGFAGKIKLSPIDKNCLLSKEHESSYQLFGEILFITGISSVVIGLLPFDKEITLNHFNTTYNRYKNVKTKIKNIKALTYLLQKSGLLSVNSYHISFKSDTGCYAEFKNNILIIRHSDKTLLNNLIEKYKHIRQEVS